MFPEIALFFVAAMFPARQAFYPHLAGGDAPGAPAPPTIALQHGWRYGMIVPGVIAIVAGLFLCWRLRDTPSAMGLPTVGEWRQDALEIAQQSGAYITLTNPDYQPEDLKVSVLLGYASTEIETVSTSLNTKNKDTFSDFSYGISLQDRVIEGKPFYWTLDYIRYYKDDNLRVDGLGLGVTYAF